MAMMKINAKTLAVFQINTAKIIEELTPNLLLRGVIKENESISIQEDAVYKYSALIDTGAGLPPISEVNYLLISSDAMYQISEACVVGDNDHYFTLRITVNRRYEKIKQTAHNVDAFDYLVKCDLLLKDYSFEMAKTLAEYMADRFDYNPRIIENTNNLIKYIRKTSPK